MEVTFHGVFVQYVTFIAGDCTVPYLCCNTGCCTLNYVCFITVNNSMFTVLL